MTISSQASTIIVGAEVVQVGTNNGQGAAYVFKREDTVWRQQQKLTAYDGSAGDRFGTSIALSGETLIVGARFNRVSSNIPQGAAYIFNLGGASPFDFDGDGKTDVSIFRPSNGQWWINRSSDNSTFARTFGQSTDRLAPADFTGDGKTDIALFRPANGNWFILRSEDGSFFSFPFGMNGDLPAPGDYDGDGKADAAVFRPSSGTWYISNSSGSGNSIVQFGTPEDKPVAADYDGDGKSDIAIFRPSNSTWYVNRSTNGSLIQQFGLSLDKPVPNSFVP